MRTTERGQAGRPTTEQVTDPQAAREAVIRGIFREQHKFLCALFAKDGPTMVARSLSSAIQALKMRDPKTGELSLASIAPEAIAEKCIACHHMGLEPVTEAYLIPFKGNLQIIKAPQGLIKLMANAGWRVEARAVREGDFFEHDLGDDGFIKHRKATGRREGAVTYGYAFAKHVSGGPTIRDVLSWDDIESYRLQSKQPDGPMWSGNYEGAVRKTMIHRIAEFVPLPSEVRSLTREAADGIEVPEEIWQSIRAKAEAGKAAPAPEMVPASADGREEAGA
ncbi:MAG TPA: recombinase RecT [Elusimicrobiota bacterium]|jgi:phage RecT family recombinase|nr:recombinase RecT [Elusimicrobiota bacterium]